MLSRLRLASLIFLPGLVFTTAYLSFSAKDTEISPAEPNSKISALQSEKTKDSDDGFAFSESGLLRILAIGIDNTGSLADVILYAVFDSKADTLSVLQLPRDLYIGERGNTGKINEACRAFSDASPAEDIADIIEREFCLPVDHSVCVTLSGVRRAVDILGGVPITLESDINYLPGKTLPAGDNILDGERAEWLLRCRSAYENADLGRIEAQRDFLLSAMNKARALSALELLSAAKELYPYIKTDLTVSEIVSLVPEVKKLSAGDITFTAVPVYGETYKGLSVLCMNRYRLAETLNSTVLSDTPVSPWDLTLFYPENEDRNETRHDDCENEEHGGDTLEGIVRRLR